MSDLFTVVGGTSLRGEAKVVGAKNSALKLMAAALLAVGRSRLTNMPAIKDVDIMAELLRRLGCEVDYDAQAGVVEIDVPERLGHRADYELVRKLRASISVLGPLIARTGAAEVAVPGGDVIGSRGLDLHAEGLGVLGASASVEHGYFVAKAEKGLHGGVVELAFPSVGATETILMAAVLAKGTTVIRGVAREPEIVDICECLAEAGAIIEGAGSPTLTVTGVDALRPLDHATVPDRIAAGTWAFAAATTCGDIDVRGGRADHLEVPLSLLADAGAHVSSYDGGFRVVAPSRGRAFDIATLPYPGFPTDLQPFALVYDAVAEGSALITENLFEARFWTAQEMARLGAHIRIDGHHALVRGASVLSGAPVEAGDIRAGAALVIAGLVADGTTVVRGVHHIDRGYVRFEEQMRALGADVTRSEDTEEW